METKVLPINYDEDIESVMQKEKCNVVGIEEMSITYSQLPDTNSSPNEYQALTLTTRMAESVTMKEAEKKEGFYFDLTIPEGQHWSVNNGEELKAIVDDFKERLYYHKQQKKK